MLGEEKVNDEEQTSVEGTEEDSTNTDDTESEVGAATKAVQDVLVKKEDVEEEVEKDDEVTDKTDGVKEVVEDDKAEKEEVKDDSTNKDDSETTKTDSDSVESLKLPKRLLHAAKRAHMKDEEVLKLGENAELVLSRLADGYDAVSERLGKLGQEAKVNFRPKTKEAKEVEIKLPEDFEDTELGGQLKKVFEGLTSKITTLEEALESKDDKTTQASLKERDKKVDSYFDGVSKDYPEFGDSKTLTEVALVMRQNVFGKADDILLGASMNGEDVSLEDALEQAMSIYEGKNPRKVKEKLVKEAIKREKTLISRPRSKRNNTFGSKGGTDLAVKAVKSVMKERGTEGW